MTADLNMSYGSISKGDRTAAPGHQLVMPFLRCGRQMAAALSPCGPCCVNCHLEANEPAKRRAVKSTGSEAEPEKGTAKKNANSQRGYISNRHSSALKFSRAALSE